MATRRTLKSNLTIKEIIKEVKARNKNTQDKIIITKLEIKNLANEIDKNFKNFDLLNDLLQKNLFKYNDYDAVIMGCTHYNFVKAQIKKILPNTTIISCESPVAKRVKFVLERENLKAEFTQKQKKVIILTKPNVRMRNFLEKYLAD
jgi:glutamate racemase